jgi:hypothetical protein
LEWCIRQQLPFLQHGDPLPQQLLFEPANEALSVTTARVITVTRLATILLMKVLLSD